MTTTSYPSRSTCICAAFLLMLASLLAPDATARQEVVRMQDAAVSLDRALSEATGSVRGEHLIAVSFYREMCAGCRMGSFRWNQNDERTLNEIFEGVPHREASVASTARRVLDEMDDQEAARENSDDHDRIVSKRVVILFRSDDRRIQDVHFTTGDLPYAHDDLRITWLGDQEAHAVFELVQSRYASTRSDEVRKGLLWSSGRIPLPDAVIPFLITAVEDSDASEVRKAGVYALGSQEHRDAVRFLLQVVERDDDKEVRKAAMYSLGNSDLPEARDALLDFIERWGRSGSD